MPRPLCCSSQGLYEQFIHLASDESWGECERPSARLPGIVFLKVSPVSFFGGASHKGPIFPDVPDRFQNPALAAEPLSRRPRERHSRPPLSRGRGRQLENIEIRTPEHHSQCVIGETTLAGRFSSMISCPDTGQSNDIHKHRRADNPPVFECARGVRLQRWNKPL